MKVAGALGEGIDRLTGGPNPRLDAEVLLAWARGCTRAELLGDREERLTARELARYRRALDRRARGEPVAYLLGRREFMSLDFEVNPAVLIPRPETEVLVEEACRLVAGRGAVLADAGTGSGAVAVALAHHCPGTVVYATDCSEAALEVARRNARRLGVGDRVRFHAGDHLEPLQAAGVAGISGVLSNPPYVPTADLARLPVDVRAFEPLLALDGGPDGLRSHRILAAEAARLLGPGGWLGLEVGPGQAQAVAAIMAGAGFGGPRVLPDLAGRPRAVFAELGS
ncbi:MAG: peptide chain release factor N(5)-glutamine methyltransferase [bacterium]|nr:peptide chain release factor N(5)-glutamine methyltransferase [bacterium]